MDILNRIDKDWSIKREAQDDGPSNWIDKPIYSQQALDKAIDAIHRDIDWYGNNFDNRIFEPYFIKRLIDDRLGFNYKKDKNVKM